MLERSLLSEDKSVFECKLRWVLIGPPWIQYESSLKFSESSLKSGPGHPDLGGSELWMASSHFSVLLDVRLLFKAG
jgi:hypothetical protein